MAQKKRLEEELSALIPRLDALFFVKRPRAFYSFTIFSKMFILMGLFLRVRLWQ